MSIESLCDSYDALSRSIDRELATATRGKKARELSATLGKSHNYISSIRPRKGETTWGGTVETRLKILKRIFGK